MTREGLGKKSVRCLNTPGKLLDTWVKNHRLDIYQREGYYLWSASLPHLASVLGDYLYWDQTEYAFTLTFGVMYRAPILTQVDQIAILIPDTANPREIARLNRLKPATEGANVVLLSAKTQTPFLYRQKVDDLWIASDIQLYLDLMSSPARGKEQAEHLRRERLGF